MKYFFSLIAIFAALACQSSVAKEKGNPSEVAVDTFDMDFDAGFDAGGGDDFDAQPAKAKEDAATQPVEATTQQSRGSLSLAFTGDVLMGTNFPDSSYITKDRGRSLFAECDSLLKAADVAIGNLEGTCYFGTQGECRKAASPNSKSYFIFRMPGDHAERLVEAGFDAMGIANNHAGDFGPTGRRLTQENLRRVGMLYSGQKGGGETTVIERGGVRYGYVAFAASCGNTNDLNNAAECDALLKKMRPQCDILIVSFHGGAEGTAHSHVPCKTEMFLGENRGDVHKFAHECIDLGADIVIGHGPHVPRAMELYKGHLIAYSLGNFCAPYRMGIAGATGYAPLLCVDIDAKTGEFQQGKIHSYKQVKTVGPRRDATNAAAKNIAALTRQDFPNSGLDITDEGDITRQ